MQQRPFRFTTSMPRLTGSMAEWRDEVRRIEDLGFHAVSVSDHVAGGWSMDPIVAMTVAAEATTTLRVAATVLNNDFRHPVMVHRAIANLDVFSGGRVELGLGAGWKPEDYSASGLAFDEPAVRVARLAEAVDLLLRLFGDGPVTHAGHHYAVRGVDGLPKPVQRPHPPLLIGGGSRRVLELAGRRADIVGINARLRRGVRADAAVAEMTPENIARKIGWARDAAAAAGRDASAMDVQLQLHEISVTHSGREHRARSSHAAQASPDQLAASPCVLRGDVAACIDHVTGLRERFGVNYLHLGGNPDAVAPIVSALASA